jgi:hypothetical protein
MWHGRRGAVFAVSFSLIGVSLAALTTLGGPVTGESHYLVTWGGGSTLRVEVSPLRWFLSAGALVTLFVTIVLAGICGAAALGRKPNREAMSGCCHVCRRRQRIACVLFVGGFLTALIGGFVSLWLHDTFHPGARRPSTSVSITR